MSDIGNVYRSLGLHQDAKAFLEQTLEFRRRSLPENHADIGVASSYMPCACDLHHGAVFDGFVCLLMVFLFF